MNIEYLKPQSIESIFIYLQALRSLVCYLNNLKSSPVNLFTESEKIPDSVYKMMKILQDIYEIMPIKVKIDKGLNGVTISTKLEDNLFYAKLNIPFITSQLLELNNYDNKWFFIFNYYFRNAQTHFKHLAKRDTLIGTNKNISTYGFKTIIDRQSSKLDEIFKGLHKVLLYYGSIEMDGKKFDFERLCINDGMFYIKGKKLQLKKGCVPNLDIKGEVYIDKDLYKLRYKETDSERTINLLNDEVLIKWSNDEQQYQITAFIDMDFISRLVIDLKLAFAKGLSDLKDFINRFKYNEINGLQKSKYLKIINYYIEYLKDTPTIKEYL